MPDIFTGTSLGASKWGPPTGRKVAYRRNENSILASTRDGPYDGWQYVACRGVRRAVAAPVERAPPPVDKPIMKLAEIGEVGEVVLATVEEPPAPTLPADAAAA